MSSPQEVAEAFFAAWGEGRLIESIEEMCAPDCVWTNTGFPDAPDRAAMVGMMQAFMADFGLASIDVVLRNVAVNGDMVLTERTDKCVNAAGEVFYDLPVAGALQVRDGKVVQLRDYWDPRFFLGEG